VTSDRSGHEQPYLSGDDYNHEYKSTRKKCHQSAINHPSIEYVHPMRTLLEIFGIDWALLHRDAKRAGDHNQVVAVKIPFI
jgi:hypothetical protein